MTTFALIGHRRFIHSDSRPDGRMAIAFTLISLLGLLVFSGAGDVPAALIFLGLVLIYISDSIWHLERIGGYKTLD